MSQPTIQVTIVDATGVQRTFDVGHVDLDCGGGCIDIRPGKPAFCRGFDHGVLKLDDGTSVTTLKVIRGMASLNGDAVNVICESASMEKHVWGEDPIAAASSPRLREEQESPVGSHSHDAALSEETISPSANTIPTQPTEATTNKQQTANYII